MEYLIKWEGYLLLFGILFESYIFAAIFFIEICHLANHLGSSIQKEVAQKISAYILNIGLLSLISGVICFGFVFKGYANRSVIPYAMVLGGVVGLLVSTRTLKIKNQYAPYIAMLIAYISTPIFYGVFLLITDKEVIKRFNNGNT